MQSNLYIDADPEEEIVISGIAGRFPNSDNLKELKGNILNKMYLGTSDHNRWNNGNISSLRNRNIFFNSLKEISTLCNMYNI